MSAATDKGVLAGVFNPVHDTICARTSMRLLIEALNESVAEIELLRGAMFDVYATAHNDGDVIAAVERMRDAMDKPWSVDKSRAALARCNGGAA